MPHRAPAQEARKPSCGKHSVLVHAAARGIGRRVRIQTEGTRRLIGKPEWKVGNSLARAARDAAGFDPF
jgi:hypothetical protein